MLKMPRDEADQPDLEVGFHSEKTPLLSPEGSAHQAEGKIGSRPAPGAPTSGPAPQTPRVTSCVGLEGLVSHKHLDSSSPEKLLV